MYFGINSFNNITNVYQHSEEYLRKNDLKKDLDRYCCAYHTLLQIIPENAERIMSGHTFPFIESYEDLEKSFQLACLGFYKASFVSLRSVLELGLLSVYWNRQNEAHIEVRSWVKSKEDTPYKKHIIDGLLSMEDFKTFQNQIDITSEIEELYGQFSNYVHTKGVKYSSRASSLSNINNFSEKGFNRWIDLMRNTVRIVVTCHLIKYPVSLCNLPIDEKFGLNTPMGLINPHETEYLINILPSEYQTVLKVISENNVEAQDVAKWVYSLPDVTEEEFEEQFINQEKIFMEGGGFNQWFLGTGRLFLKMSISDSVALNKLIKQILILKAWAKTNDCMEPKYKIHQKQDTDTQTASI